VGFPLALGATKDGTAVLIKTEQSNRILAEPPPTTPPPCKTVNVAALLACLLRHVIRPRCHRSKTAQISVVGYDHLHVPRKEGPPGGGGHNLNARPIERLPCGKGKQSLHVFPRANRRGEESSLSMASSKLEPIRGNPSSAS
jgi:hypothetical protein